MDYREHPNVNPFYKASNAAFDKYLQAQRDLLGGEITSEQYRAIKENSDKTFEAYEAAIKQLVCALEDVQERAPEAWTELQEFSLQLGKAQQ